MYIEDLLYVGSKDAVQKSISRIKSEHPNYEGMGLRFGHHLTLNDSYFHQFSEKKNQHFYDVLSRNNLTDALLLIFPETDDDTDLSCDICREFGLSSVSTNLELYKDTVTLDGNIGIPLATDWKTVVFVEGLPHKLNLWKPVSSFTF